MRTLAKDILTAAVMGLVVPGIVLSIAARQTDTPPETTPETTAQTVQPTAQETVRLPVLVRQEDGTVSQMDMDGYLVGVVLAEMPVSFEEEALEAQSVVARTYARKAWETGGKHGDCSVCTRSACCQGYIGDEDYLSQGGTEEGLEKVRAAVAATSGWVLTYEGELIEATYFSCSGGSTEDAAAVWGTEFPYLQAVASPGEEKAAHYTDTVRFSAGSLSGCPGRYPQRQPRKLVPGRDLHRWRRRRYHCHRRDDLQGDRASFAAGSALHGVFRIHHRGYRHRHHQRLRPPGGHEPVRRGCHGRHRKHLPGNSGALLSGNHTDEAGIAKKDLPKISKSFLLLDKTRK